MSDSRTAITANHSALERLFAPKSVAVIGATDREGTVGRTVLQNLLSRAFGGTVYAVNPRRTEVLGLKCYARVGDIPEKPDLALVITPAPTVPDVVGECVDAGAGGAVVVGESPVSHSYLD